MKKNNLKKYVLVVLLGLLSVAGCGGGGNSVIFDQPVLAAVDSDNDRLFVIEKDGVLSVFTASTTAKIGDQPFVKEDRNDAIRALLPNSPTHVEVMALGSTSRLFITGTQTSSSTKINNRILVLDFDGTTLGEASISPLAVGTDTSSVIGGLKISKADSRLYATNASDGKLNIFNPSTGVETDTALTIAGIPNKMALANGKLYVANASSVTGEQLITVVDTAALTTTTINQGIPLNDIAAISNDSGTLLLARPSNSLKVFVYQVNTTTFASVSNITANNSTVANGQISASNAITSSVDSILLTKKSDGTIYGYVGQEDGIVTILNISSDLSGYSAESLASDADGLVSSVAFGNSTSFVGTKVFLVSYGAGTFVSTDVGSSTLSIKL